MTLLEILGWSVGRPLPGPPGSVVQSSCKISVWDEQTMTRQRDDYDSPWKEALARYFESFLTFFFPAMAVEVDWSRGYELLEHEFRQVVRDSVLGRRTVDALVRVYLLGGQESWILAHVEVQNQVDVGFPERMFVYYYRIYDRFHRPVVSLAILGDSNPNWRPDGFEMVQCGCRLLLDFPMAKLLDYEHRLPELEHSKNPFAVLVAAHLQAHRTSRVSKKRLHYKLALVRSLYERGFSREDILELFRLVDWILALSAENSRVFQEELERYEEEKKMPYVTSVERSGIKKGREQGREQGVRKGRQQGVRKGRQQGVRKGRQQGGQDALLVVLESRFQLVPPDIQEQVRGLQAPEVLTNLTRQAATVDSMDGFVQALAVAKQTDSPS